MRILAESGFGFHTRHDGATRSVNCDDGSITLVSDIDSLAKELKRRQRRRLRTDLDVCDQGELAAVYYR